MKTDMLFLLASPLIIFTALLINVCDFLYVAPYEVFKSIYNEEYDLRYEAEHYMLLIYFFCPLFINSSLLIVLVKGMS